MSATEVNITDAARDLEEPLVRYATRILGDRERARDVVQDAFLKLHQEAQAGNDVAEKPRRWLFTVCRNRALDILRRQKRMCALDSIDDAEGAVDANSFERRAAGEVVEMFDRLPDKQRRVMEMRFGEDKSYRTIGEATGISTGHVGYLIHDGIRVLRRHLGVASVLLLLGVGTFLFMAQSERPESTPIKDNVPAVTEPEAQSQPAALPAPAPEPAPTQLPSPRMAPPKPRAAAPAASAEPAASASASASAIPPFLPPAPHSSSGTRRRMEAE